MSTQETPPQEDIELDHEALATSVERGIEQARTEISETYGPNGSLESYLPYHGVSHTDGAIERANLIVSTIRDVSGDSVITERQAKQVPLWVAFHDVKQGFDLDAGEDRGFRTIKRVRHTVQNETDSANKLTQFMTTENTNSVDSVIYTDEDMQIGQDAILSTIPDWSTEFGTVTQPKRVELEAEGMPLAAAIVALADLGTAGIDGGEAFLRDGNQLFLEENVEIAHLLNDPQTMSEEQMAWIKERLVDYAARQKAFIEGRMQLLDSDLGAFPYYVAQALKERIFTKFGDSLKAADAAIARRNEASPSEVIAELRTVLEFQQPNLEAA